jgi:superfamily I DNA/RNA helicase
MAKALVDALPGRPKGLWFSRTKREAQESLREQEEGALIDATQLQEIGVQLTPLIDAGSAAQALSELKVAKCSELLRIVERHGEGALVLEPRILLTTIHAAKGRESDVVVVDLQAPLPTLREVERGEAELQTERRVLYVALTRARRHLALVHPANPGQSLGVLLGL